jgi:hypothetical protein
MNHYTTIENIYHTITEGEMTDGDYLCKTQHGVNVEIYHFHSIGRKQHIGTIEVRGGNSYLHITEFSTEGEKEELRKCVGFDLEEKE